MSEKMRLLLELQQEKKNIASLKLSIAEMTTEFEEQDTQNAKDVNEVVEQKSDSENDSQWKVKFEAQNELNMSLEKQLNNLKERILAEKNKLKILSSGGELEDFKGSNAKKTIIRLTREKQNLQSQLRDYEWRLDQEASAYQKADGKRTALIKDIAKSAGNKPSKQSIVGKAKNRQGKKNSFTSPKAQKQLSKRETSSNNDSEITKSGLGRKSTFTAGVSAKANNKLPRLPEIV